MEAYIKQIREEIVIITGNRLPTIVLPSDSNALLERLNVLMTSKAAIYLR